MKFGFTKDMRNYTHSTSVLDDKGKAVWAVVPIPPHWRSFGDPIRWDGRDGFMSRRRAPRDTVYHLHRQSMTDPIIQIFFPLRVLHSLKV